MRAEWLAATVLAVMIGAASVASGADSAQPATGLTKKEARARREARQEARAWPVGWTGRSWAAVDANVPFVLTEGEAFEVTVHYNLDAAEAVDGKWANIAIEGLGPWLDSGPRRQHIWYPNMQQSRRVEVGSGSVTFRFTAPRCKWRDQLQMRCQITDDAGHAMPFEVRSHHIRIRNVTRPLWLETDAPANLFTYDEPVAVKVGLRGAALGAKGDRRTVAWEVKNIDGAQVAAGRLDVTSKGEKDQVAPLPLDIKERGTFLVRASIEGQGGGAEPTSAETMICRVPDVEKLTGRGPTLFGGSSIVEPGDPADLEMAMRASRRMGLSASRSYVRWDSVETQPGDYALEPWAKPLELAKKYGIDTVIEITTPPVWARQKGSVDSWAAVPEWDAWERFVRTFTERHKGQFWGWEWLNEITPAGWWKGSSEDYVKLCRIGTETARGIDPKLKFLLAGGMWPRSFRLDVLAAGAGKWGDVLPVHYNSGPGVRQARADLESYGAKNVTVWEDESARCLTLWDESLERDLVDRSQGEWLLEMWPDEIEAGVERLIWFGWRDPTGGWGPVWDDLTPRPVAAALAVMTSKLHGATPVGTTRLGRRDSEHVFHRDGRTIIVARSPVEETVRVPVGASKGARLTDWQGRETWIDAKGGTVEVALGRMGQYVEIEDGRAMAMAASVRLGRAAELVLTSADRGLVDPAASERVVVSAGQTVRIPLVIANPFEERLSGEFGAAGSQATKRFDVAPGETFSEMITVTAPDDVKAEDRLVEVVLHFDDAGAGRGLGDLRKASVLSIVAAERLGNLCTNGDFEAAGPNGMPVDWGAGGSAIRRVGTEGVEGTGQWCMRLETAPEQRYASLYRKDRIAATPGQKYLYSAWVYNDGMAGGSNISERMADGSSKNYTEPRVFGLRDTKCWQLYTKVYQAPEGIAAIGLSPVVGQSRPGGYALYDNVRLTYYEGTDYAAECHRRQGPVKVDGKLDEWVKTCPIPLLGPNQLQGVAEGYAWSPANLSGVGYLMWDDGSLYAAVVVRDDAVKVTGDAWGEGDPRGGDCVRLGIDPDRGSGDARSAFEMVVAQGTGGRPLVLRPEEHAGGLRTGQLYKDSSELEVAVARDEESGRTIYEMRLPWGSLGALRGSIGRRFGLTMMLGDNDGRGVGAWMMWGLGMGTMWQPDGFGCVTFVE